MTTADPTCPDPLLGDGAETRDVRLYCDECYNEQRVCEERCEWCGAKLREREGEGDSDE